MSNRKLLPGKFVWFELGPGGGSNMPPNKSEKVAVENVNHPGQVNYVDATMYRAVRRAFLKVEMMIGGINFVPSHETRTARQP